MLYSKSYSYRPSGNSQSQGFTFIPNGRAFTLLASVYTIGVATVIVLALATLAAAVYICSLLVTSICQLASQIAVSYSHADSLTQLLFIVVVGFLLYKIASRVVRSHQPVR